MLNEKIRSDFLAILSEELIPAMGCTELMPLQCRARCTSPTQESSRATRERPSVVSATSARSA